MIGENTTRQIAALAEQGCTSAAIAESLGVEEAYVKLVMQRNEVGNDRDIDDTQLASLRKHAFNLAVAAENEGIQARMTMFLIERDKPKEKKDVSPIMLINQAIVAARTDFDKLKESFQSNGQVL